MLLICVSSERQLLKAISQQTGMENCVRFQKSEGVLSIKVLRNFNDFFLSPQNRDGSLQMFITGCIACKRNSLIAGNGVPY